MANFHLVRIAINGHHRMYDETIDSLIASFHALGHVCTHAVNQIAENAINLLVGATLFAARNLRLLERLRGVPYVVYQLEALSDGGGLLPAFPEYGALLAQAAHIWDYSPSSAAFLRDRVAAPVRYLPPSYHRSLEKFRPVAAPDHDVVFIGSRHERRTRLLDDLARAGVRVLFLEGVYGEPRDRALASAKIVLNLHAWEGMAARETVRLSYLLANRCFVLSESADHDPYDRGVIYADYQAMVATCLEWLARKPSERASVAEHGYRVLTGGSMIEALRRTLAETLGIGNADRNPDLDRPHSSRSGSLINPQADMEEILASHGSFAELRAAFAGFAGNVDPAEGGALYHWSREGFGAGFILQSGNLPVGLSLWLAAGCRDSRRGSVLLAGERPPMLERALDETHLQEWVRFCPEIASSSIFRLLILGGMSSHAEYCAATNQWLGRVENYGAFVLYGVGKEPVVTRFHAEILRSNPVLREVCAVGSVRILAAR